MATTPARGSDGNLAIYGGAQARLTHMDINSLTEYTMDCLSYKTISSPIGLAARAVRQAAPVGHPTV
jgi:hypothetical protein